MSNDDPQLQGRLWCHADATPVREERRCLIGRRQPRGSRVDEQTVRAATATNTLDPTVPNSWFEIHANNTILIRTGRVDFGQSTVTTAYKQIVAEELSVPFEAVTAVVMGDTDQTPDGGVSAAYLEYGAVNLRKAAAYTHQALLDLAAKRIGVDTGALTVKDGVVAGGGKRLTYGELVHGQQLTLSIPVTGDLTSFMGLTVTGNPPMKPVSQYTIIGRSYLNYVTESKVRAEETWASDVRLPGMLHARVVHPKTLGSTLMAAGRVDTKRFPNAQVVVKGNLVGVVAPTEWEAIGAAQQVAADTTWSEWKALPGHGNLFGWMREEADWKAAPVTTSQKSQGTVPPALAAASQKLAATYEIPFMKHAPIGPTMAVADVHHYMPAMQDDRPVGALLAGLPTMPPPGLKPEPGTIGSIVNGSSDLWLYDRVPNLAEYGHGTYQLGQKASPIAVGLRDHTMRTPGQFQQNFPRELAISEAAALANMNPLAFRLRHTKDERLIGVLHAVRDASGWQSRPSPNPQARATGSTPVTGQGVSVIFRAGTYWACVCQVSVTPSTGNVVIGKYTIAVDPGIVINPLQLKRQVEGGTVMGISHALHEELMFDESGVTSRDWRTYPILTMAEVPEINVVILSNPQVGSYGGGSEAANALAAPAIAAAVLDATGKVMRRLPLKPEYVQAMLKV